MFFRKPSKPEGGRAINAFRDFLGSTLGKKFVMAVTGLIWVIFVIVHLIENLLLFAGPEPYNRYAHFLVSLGPGLWVAEAILLIALVAHVTAAISLVRENRAARPQRYATLRSKGGPSKRTFASMSMIFTGLTLLVFLVIHLKTFKYGPGIEQGYVQMIDGHRVRDLHRLVRETFLNPIYVIWYVFALVFLGFHVRHGFWSAFQSWGAAHPRYTPILYSLGALVGLALAVGFIFIPVWFYFFVGG